MNLTLQKILWPQVGICTEPAMYMRLHGAVRSGKIVTFRQGDTASFDTYFNTFSIDKWHEYTTVKDISLQLCLQGRFKVQLTAWIYENDAAHGLVLAEEEVRCQEKGTVQFAYPAAAQGLLSFTLTALDDAAFYGGAYKTCVEEKDFQYTKLALDICTFRRETFVLQNLKRITEDVLENPDSPLKDHLEVFVSDNGQTLSADSLKHRAIHLAANRNVGGAGGFTRGMMEILKANDENAGFTHAILMDDDIVFDTDILYRTYMLLSLRNERYQDAFLGGAMLRLDRPWHQVENGAAWNAGKLVSHKANYNMTEIAHCAMNEKREHHQYNAWWYCAIPMEVIRKDNLPLPIFIRGDDVEYGLRNCKKLMTLNGICVWHEPFESKYSSSMYYYILRNQCIDNALHCPAYGKEELKKDLKEQVLGELHRYRYKNADLLIRGVRDFLKGIDWLKTTDGERLHKEVMQYGYKSLPADSLEIPFDMSQYRYTLYEEHPSKKKRILMKLTRNGIDLPATRNSTVVSVMHMRAYNAYRVKSVLNYNLNNETGFVTRQDKTEYNRCMKEMKRCCKEIDQQFEQARASYRERASEIRTLDFWEKYLGLR